jgi:hypothetical protein
MTFCWRVSIGLYHPDGKAYFYDACPSWKQASLLLSILLLIITLLLV